jgi:hypothetical protein
LATLALGASTASSSSTTTDGPALSVDAADTAAQHPISPYIYGMNFADPTVGREIGLPVDRWGGNSTDTYNWKIGASNLDADWYFENAADCWSATYNYCPGMTKNTVFAYKNFIATDRSLDTKTLLTLPMVGYVAKNAPVSQPLTCGYPKSIWPDQDSFDSYDPNCGDGRHDGAVIPGRPTLDGTPITAAFDAAWVDSLVKEYGTAAKGGVAFYELGNEPSLWGVTHSDVHPAAETATELWQKSEALATAVKQADPSAQILGFSEWGWPGYFCTEADTPGNGCDQNSCTTSPDCANHGHLPMVEWYLQQFAKYDAKTKVRHLDYLDVHYYAQGGDSDQVTRSLWDPTYTDPSWIDTPIYLIPRMKCWIDGHVPGICPNQAGYYPGTKISLSEYNLSLSGVSAVTNAIIQADTLGIFAREGVGLATRWAMPYDGTLINDAFLIYRDYDGHGSQFGNTWVDSTSTNQNQLAVYGARRSSDGAYTILVLNKSSSALTSKLTLTGIASSGTARTWSWTGGSIKQVAGGTAIHSGVITAGYPAMSMRLYVITPTTPTSPTAPVSGNALHAQPRRRGSLEASGCRRVCRDAAG